MKRHLTRVMAGTLALALSLPAIGSNNFIKGKEDGWFWYETEPEILLEKEEKPLPPPPPPPQQIVKMAPPPEEKPKTKALSVEWFRETYPSILNDAIDNPTEENVAKYRYATRVMLDKASNFAHEFKKQALLDPYLDESNRYPFSQAMRGSFQNITNKEKSKAISEIGKKAGFWVFLDDTCVFCSLQYPIIARTAKELKLEVVYITPDGKRPSWMSPTDDLRKDEGQSKYLKIGIRPATAMVVPPKDITVLSQGLMSQDLLEERILYAGDAAGMLSEEIKKKAFPNRNGLLTTEDIREAGESFEKSPENLVGKVKELIEKRN